MGVRGLTSLVDQIRGSISKTHELPVVSEPSSAPNHDAGKAKRCIVVDFWAFVYWTFDLLDRRLGKQTWIQGGCYREHEQLVKHVLQVWLYVPSRLAQSKVLKP